MNDEDLKKIKDLYALYVSAHLILMGVGIIKESVLRGVEENGISKDIQND